ncbi:MAG TPA: hypothetical protein VMU04_18420 [Candidatus Acidoferrum sp.]|nr:hypothetical protein [Candidatus Acidoferrum sp.]
MQHELLNAIDLALAGQWEAAHRLVQEYDADATAAWIHAVLHKIEGDADNSRYWYRRAGKMAHFPDEPKAELAAIKQGIESNAA